MSAAPESGTLHSRRGHPRRMPVVVVSRTALEDAARLLPAGAIVENVVDADLRKAVVGETVRSARAAGRCSSGVGVVAHVVRAGRSPLATRRLWRVLRIARRAR